MHARRLAMTAAVLVAVFAGLVLGLLRLPSLIELLLARLNPGVADD